VIQPFVGLIADVWWKMRDFNATVLHLLGMNHERLTFKFQGLAQKLTRVVPAKIISGLIA
jgi:hypothetical protein